MYSLPDLQNQFSKQKINKAKKFSIREFEETEKNRFVCFVDEEAESYDVSLVINSKSEITEYSCECESRDFCLHVLAMGIFMSENKTGKAVPRRGPRKKISEIELAMDDLNSEELKTWLLEFFKKNKDAEMQFMLSFGQKKKDFSEAEISELIKNAIASVAGRRKSLTAPEVKKIVDLLTKALEPVEDYLMQNPDKKESVKRFLWLSEEISLYTRKILFSGTRMDTFQKKLRARFTANLNQTKDFDLWKEIAAENWYLFLRSKEAMTFDFYYFIGELYHFGNSDQKMYIAGLVRDEIKMWMKIGFDLRISMKQDLLGIIAENGFFAELQSYFPIEKYHNSYNLQVIREIVKIDLKKAEKACKMVIESNMDERLNLPYCEILEEIYETEGSPADSAYLKRKRFWETLSLEDYIFIAENDTDTEEFKKFRNRVLAFLKNSFSNYRETAELYFGILDYEKNYKKMLDVIDINTPTYVINLYAEKLYLTNKNKFLMAVRSRSEWVGTEEEENVLADFLASKYDAGQLEDSFGKKYYGFGSDRFSKKVLSKAGLSN
ncbi:hypothetical protein [Chryseobacterium hagamense]|uniref:SWIM-type domain-containing protein n=1 Tax=Chryseobacterium hagamense TaxID=395935 RepID=A0A511YJE0_9FLAO|nr:hypothetical protein [Chryseobacterium hagamense]GEN75256.1 hypothetical protein CHA01nite_09960 [Chryseobacterium hagamense]